MNPAQSTQDSTHGVKRASLTAFIHPRYWPAFLGFGLLWLLIHIPRFAQTSVTKGLGQLGFWIARRERRVTLTNLRLAYPTWPENRIREVARAHFQSLIYSVLEAGLVWFKTKAQLAPMIEMKGVEHLKQALAAGRGVLLIGAHFTTNEIAATALGLLDLPLDVMYRPTDHPVIQELALRGRSRWGGRLIPNNQFVELLRSLKQNRIVLFAPDQRYTGDGALSVPLFNVPALSNPATTIIHRATRCQVLLYSQLRLPNGHYQMQIHAPMAQFPSADAAQDILTYHRFIESMVERAPEQYLWSYKRFRPKEGEPDPYRQGAIRKG